MGIIMGFFRLLLGLAMLLLRFALPFLLGGLIVFFIRRRRGPKTARPRRGGRALVRQLKDLGIYGGTVRFRDCPPEEPEPPSSGAQPKPPLSAQPDLPQPFGFKTAWLAVRCDDPTAVMDAMGVTIRIPANWKTGLPRAGGREGVFVSPCLSGYVLVIGAETLLKPDDSDCACQLGARFPEVQLFASHRVSSFFRWTKFQDGQKIRDYCWCGEQGDVLWEEGGMTAEEWNLGLDALPHGEGVPGGRIPEEEDVRAVAAAWGVDPDFRGQPYEPGTGWLCR